MYQEQVICLLPTYCDVYFNRLALAKQAAELGIVTQVIRDAGRTQIAPGSLTALAVGPGMLYIYTVV